MRAKLPDRNIGHRWSLDLEMVAIRSHAERARGRLLLPLPRSELPLLLHHDISHVGACHSQNNSSRNWKIWNFLLDGWQVSAESRAVVGNRFLVTYFLPPRRRDASQVRPHWRSCMTSIRGRRCFEKQNFLKTSPQKSSSVLWLFGHPIGASFFPS